MKVLLLKPVNNLGLAGSVVNVSDGYAINYLIPNKLASSSLSVSVQKVSPVANQVVTEQSKKLISEFANLHKIGMKVTANEKGKLYEAIKAGQVASLLRTKKKINIKAEQIRFVKPIKELGEFIVEVKIVNQIVNFKLIVEKI